MMAFLNNFLITGKIAGEPIFTIEQINTKKNNLSDDEKKSKDLEDKNFFDIDTKENSEKQKKNNFSKSVSKIVFNIEFSDYLKNIQKFNCIAWGYNAELINKYFKDGSYITLSTEIFFNSLENNLNLKVFKIHF